MISYIAFLGFFSKEVHHIHVICAIVVTILPMCLNTIYLALGKTFASQSTIETVLANMGKLFK